MPPARQRTFPLLLALGYGAVAALCIFGLTDLPPAAKVPANQPVTAAAQALPPAPVFASEAESPYFLQPSLSQGITIGGTPEASGQFVFVVNVPPQLEDLSLEQLEAEHDALNANFPVLSAKAEQLRQEYHIKDPFPGMVGVCTEFPAPSKERQQLEAQIAEREAVVNEIAAEISRLHDTPSDFTMTEDDKASLLHAQNSKLSVEQSALALLRAQSAAIKDRFAGFMEYYNIKNAYHGGKARLAQIDERLNKIRAHLEPIPLDHVRDWRHPRQMSICSATH